jgi:hypothetical protein
MSVIERETKAAPRMIHLPPLRGFGIACVFMFSLAMFGLMGRVRVNPRLFWSLMGAVTMLLAWSAVLFPSAWRRGRTFTLLPAGMPADGDLCVLGLVLAAGIRLVLSGDRAIGIRVCL